MYRMTHPLAIAQFLSMAQNNYETSARDILEECGDEVSLYNRLNKYLNETPEYDKSTTFRTFEQFRWMRRQSSLLRDWIRTEGITIGGNSTIDDLEDVERGLLGKPTDDNFVREYVDALDMFRLRLHPYLENMLSAWDESMMHFPTDLSASFWESHQEDPDRDHDPTGWWTYNEMSGIWRYRGETLVEALYEYIQHYTTSPDRLPDNPPFALAGNLEYDADTIDRIMNTSSLVPDKPFYA